MAKAKEVYGDEFDVELELDANVGSPGEGIHKAKCVDARIKPNKARDSHNIELDFEITAGPDQGKTTRMWLSMKEAARWKVTETLQDGFGIEPKHDKNGKPRTRLRRQDVVGKKVRLHIVLQDVNGEERASVERVLPPREDKVPGSDGAKATATGKSSGTSKGKAKKEEEAEPEEPQEEAEEAEEEEAPTNTESDDDNDEDSDEDDDDGEVPPEEDLPF